MLTGSWDLHHICICPTYLSVTHSHRTIGQEQVDVGLQKEFLLNHLVVSVEFESRVNGVVSES
jgi:hypothetical protein